MEQHNQSGVVINNPSLDLQGVSKPVTKLIEVVAQGIGAVYKPVGSHA
jgi:hypothetical protein